MLADVPLEARSQSKCLQFFSVDLVCTWGDQTCAARMREALMDEFLLVMIDRLSAQKKHSRQAAIALKSDIQAIVQVARKPTLLGGLR